MLFMKGFLVMAASFSSASTSEGTWAEAAEKFELGPVPAQVDLRTMLCEHIVRRSCEALDRAAERRANAVNEGAWHTWRDAIRKRVREDLGKIRFGPDGPPLNVRPVARHERPHYVIENVLFESLPGWDVNASVYLPLEEHFPPPWPAVVIPVGHSAKTRESYQVPAQVFARLGYTAVTFDPPGMAGEKRAGNDHFRDGVRCYLTGHSSNRYFVADAIRCIDYLASRDDVMLANGVGITGVSGGGYTAMFAALLDDRIRCVGPSCCAVPNAMHPVIDVYAPCAETLAAGRFAYYDDVDVLAAAAPTPMLLMAGAQDEVFKIEWGRDIASKVRAFYAAADNEKAFGFFVDPGGHAYTVAMALEFTKWLDRYVRNTPDREIPAYTRDDFEMVDDAMLACHPRQEENMFTLNRALAERLRDHRSGLPIPEAIRQLVTDVAAKPEVVTGPPVLAWFHNVQEILIEPEPGIALPATFLAPAEEGWRGAAVLYFDDKGRWESLRTHGMLARMSGFLDKNTDGPAILTVDLRGWGDSEPADLPYDLAGWGGRDRWISYVSAALGDHVLGMRIRDGLAALAYLRSRAEIDPERIIVGGNGMGGVVALHVAAVHGRVAGVFSMNGLATFESLATHAEYTWPQQAFLPGVLEHYDLPELIAAVDMPVL
ncbi:MAG: alpha/beta hydrolase, partial [Candidatus Hydrogenedentota bacterium]